MMDIKKKDVKKKTVKNHMTEVTDQPIFSLIKVIPQEAENMLKTIIKRDVAFIIVVSSIGSMEILRSNTRGDLRKPPERKKKQVKPVQAAGEGDPCWLPEHMEDGQWCPGQYIC